MDWKVVGAIEQTGEEITRVFDARDRAEAEAKARRAGILVSSAEPAEEVNHLGVLEYRGRPDTSPLFPLPKPPPAAAAPIPTTPAVRKRRSKVRPATRGQVNVLIALAAALLLCQLLAWLAPRRAATEWEYRVEAPPDRLFEAEVNRLGGEGWELVTARRVASGDEFNPKYELVFKRARR
jgi:hypothetical protein